jgi:hypothetical protein
MKYLLPITLLLSPTAFAAELTIYRCDYRIVKPDGKILEMSGNIVADDVNSTPNATTYLTLAPNESSGDTTEARILITGDGYNPITLHKAGQSATTLGFSELKGDHGELGYRAENGTAYSVICKRR